MASKIYKVPEIDWSKFPDSPPEKVSPMYVLKQNSKPLFFSPKLIQEVALDDVGLALSTDNEKELD